MLSTQAIILCVLGLAAFASASPNGNLYGCDFVQNEALGDYVCKFKAVEYEGKIITPVEHSIDLSIPVEERQVESEDGTPLTVTPKPWTNGDKLAGGASLEGYGINYVRMFEMIGNLRNVMMYHPQTMDREQYDLLTAPLVKCNVKDKTTSGTGPFSIYSTDDLWDHMHWDSDPTGSPGPSQHHPILQYLEEGAVDMVCLVTDLEMDRCDVIRAHNGISKGDVMDCWVDAYKAITGQTPVYYDGQTTVYPTYTETLMHWFSSWMA